MPQLKMVVLQFTGEPLVVVTMTLRLDWVELAYMAVMAAQRVLLLTELTVPLREVEAALARTQAIQALAGVAK
jgi:hypothetical protein